MLVLLNTADTYRTVCAHYSYVIMLQFITVLSQLVTLYMHQSTSKQSLVNNCVQNTCAQCNRYDMHISVMKLYGLPTAS
jgi:hypothetical protein